ncbi:hypothetical protein HS088_TW01G00461 [Tripterygium wilfordii]|uniref:Acid phosphatase n=1 Tax=Tripterygium wilfordii TaxID=458696 RepID=A0A7J7E2L4_TRIWF|nr:uncharacterized protein At2g39920 [Tripterygium wilfordii]XP_038702727.1 uncharacterized protein At2g39920 [Tripterygium wilfordii]XP_038702735.1 uncharacterized protein At2g39920 [Tripterygium wilfordii]KAF5752546.1 hypothetical protein HS088_TW01G00461 [Tripterygium wilfordii]
MSAYAHQMERQFSTASASLSSRGNSDMGSRYVVESGFYMTAFAATIFIAALVTVGVLLITLLIALTVMLQSCQSKNSGVVEIQKLNEDYNYCTMYASHAELNNLGADGFPSVCLSVAIQYIKEHQYERDLNFTMSMIERYFESVLPLDDRLDVVLIDIDDIVPLNSWKTNPLTYGLDRYRRGDCFEEAKHLKYTFFLRLYIKLRESGWPLILLSRKPERQRNATTEHLLSAGYSGWYSLIMRLDDEMRLESREYFSSRRALLLKEGFRLSAIISSQMDALTGQYLGKGIFKLPNPIYFSFEQNRNISYKAQ